MAWLVRSATPLVLSLTLLLAAHAGEVLEAVNARSLSRCGVSEGIPGFFEQGDVRRWRGLDADRCRVLAAAHIPLSRLVRDEP